MFRNVLWNSKLKKMTLLGWDENGKPNITHHAFKPYYYIEDGLGKYTSLFGTPLTKREFDTPWEKYQDKETLGIKRLFEDLSQEQQFLLDHFAEESTKDEFTQYPLNIVLYDIETDVPADNSFPEAKDAPMPINLITAVSTLDRKFITFGTRPYTRCEKPTHIPDSDYEWEYVYCETEYKLLVRYTRWIQKQAPDIISGWNSKLFDDQYTFNRIKKIISEDYLKYWSPVEGAFRERDALTNEQPPREYVQYTIPGVTLLDYIDIYKKFKGKKQPTYRLEYIANEELGASKLEYEGTIGEFMESDWDTFVDYNVRDVELLLRMEDKLAYFAILRMIAVEGCCTLDKAMTTVVPIAGAIVKKARKVGVKIFTPIRDIVEGKNIGGFCQAKPGLVKNLVTFDCASMYPNTCITLNISPETKIGWVDEHIADPDKVTVRTITGQTIETNRNKLVEVLKAKKWGLSKANIIYDQKVVGLYPQVMDEIYQSRVGDKTEISKLKKERQDCKDPERKTVINTRLAQLDAMQYAKKILINSFYGTMTSKKCPFGDDDLGNSITATSQWCIKSVNDIIRNHMTEKYGITDPETLENAITFNDTDSAGANLSCLNVEICKDGKVTELGHEIINDLTDTINQKIKERAYAELYCGRCTLSFAREKICDYGIYRAKKHYILHMIDNEGYPCDSWKYSGVELATASLDKELKKLAQWIIEPMVTGKEKDETDERYREGFTKFKNLPLMHLCTNQTIKTYNKFLPNCDGFKLPKGMTGRAKAAYLTNLVCEMNEITSFETIRQGDDCKILLVAPNPYHIASIAFKTDMPHPFLMETFTPNYQVLFHKTIGTFVDSLYDAAGWQKIDPTSSLALDFTSLFA